MFVSTDQTIPIYFNKGELLTLLHYLSVLPMSKTADQTWEGMFMVRQLYGRIKAANSLIPDDPRKDQT